MLLSAIRDLPEKHPFLLACGINALFMLVIFTTRGIVFETVDDYNVMMTLSGDKTGSPYFQTTFFNSLFAYIITRFYLLYDGVQWYSLFQLLFIHVALTVILAVIMEKGGKRHVPVLYVIAVYIGFFLAVYLYPVQRMQFTSTAALLGAASCASLVSIDARDMQSDAISRRILLSVVLLSMSLIERRSAGIASSAFFVLALVRLIFSWRMNREEYPALIEVSRGLCASAIIIACTVGMLFGHLAVMDYGDNAGYLDYDKWRAEYQDHPHPAYSDAESLYQSVGWNYETYLLGNSLIYIDEGFNEDAFKAIVQSDETKAMAPSIADILKLGKSIVWKNAAGKSATIAVFGSVAVLAAIAVSNLRRRRLSRSSALDYALILLCSIMCVALSFYICSSGRWSIRTYQSVLFPLSGLVIAVLVNSIGALAHPALYGHAPHERKSDRNGSVVGSNAAQKGMCQWRIAGFSICLSIALTWSAEISMSVITDLTEKDRYSASQMASVEEYAINHPELLFIHDYTISNTYNSYDPFRVYRESKPVNLIISGGSYTYSGAYYAQLAANGRTRLDGAVMLESDVRYISNPVQSGGYVKAVKNYIESTIGENSYYTTAVLNDVHVYTFWLN